MAGGRYKITALPDGTYFFTLYSVGGRLLAQSGIYTCLSVCKKGIASLRINSDAPLEDLTLSPEQVIGTAVIKCPKIELFCGGSTSLSGSSYAGSGGFSSASIGSYNFRVRAKNGTVIASGEGYGTKSRCLDIISALRICAFSATTE